MINNGKHLSVYKTSFYDQHVFTGEYNSLAKTLVKLTIHLDTVMDHFK